MQHISKLIHVCDIVMKESSVSIMTQHKWLWAALKYTWVVNVSSPIWYFRWIITYPSSFSDTVKVQINEPNQLFWTITRFQVNDHKQVIVTQGLIALHLLIYSTPHWQKASTLGEEKMIQSGFLDTSLKGDENCIKIRPNFTKTFIKTTDWVRHGQCVKIDMTNTWV